jgi:hypothetical protein
MFGFSRQYAYGTSALDVIMAYLMERIGKITA